VKVEETSSILAEHPYVKDEKMTKVLQRPTLVLNRNWQPINVATVARALVMLWNESARVVDPTDYQLYDWDDWSKLVPDRDEPFVQAVRQRFRVPEVVTLTEFDRLPSAAATFSRRNVFKRDRFTCQYCNRQGRPHPWNVHEAGETENNSSPPSKGNRPRRQPGSDELTIDHVVPRAQGGESTWTNCVLACWECNTRKADRTPKQAKMRLRKEPTRPTWKPLYSEHASRMESWSKFISEAYWNAELES
jgi:5-methylcytosine-specific restriction endonuclease McrA